MATRSCLTCGKTAQSGSASTQLISSETPAKLQKCGRCLEATYCSIKCQSTDWPAHKEWCINVDEIYKAVAESAAKVANQRFGFSKQEEQENNPLVQVAGHKVDELCKSRKLNDEKIKKFLLNSDRFTKYMMTDLFSCARNPSELRAINVNTAEISDYFSHGPDAIYGELLRNPRAVNQLKANAIEVGNHKGLLAYLIVYIFTENNKNN